MHKSLKDIVLESTDIVDVIGERVSLSRKGKDYVGLCPFHNDHKPSMSVVPKKQLFKCFACGAGGDVFKFVMLNQRVEFREALQILAKRAGIELEPQNDATRQQSARRDSLRNVLTWARKHFQRNLLEQARGGPALEYARKRGLSDETIERFSLGFAADDWTDLLNAGLTGGVTQEDLLHAGLITTHESGRVYDKFRNRLMFPIADGQGRVVAFGGRTLGTDPAKYMNSPETALFSKSRVLYALDLARPAIEQSRQAVVVEGYVDAVMLHQAGITNVVATLGTALTDAHVKSLAHGADTIYMCFDGDTAGLKAADRAVEIALQHRVDVRVTVLPADQDPDELIQTSGSEAFKSLLQSSIDALEFKWNSTRSAFEQAGRRGQREAIDGFLQFIARTGSAKGLDETEQGLVIGRLSEMLAVPARTVYDLLAKARAAGKREAIVITPDTSSESSTYEASVRGIPAVSRAIVEELFWIACSGAEFRGSVQEMLQAHVNYAQVASWAEFLGLLCNLSEQAGEYSPADVFAELDSPVLCEVFHQCQKRSTPRAGYGDGQVDRAEYIQSVCDRARVELDRLRGRDAQSQLRHAESDRSDCDRLYRESRELGRRQSGSCLGSGQRLMN
jgi:DNA primase